MEHPLFVYGTLRDPDLLVAVLGRPLRAGEALEAVAPGYRATYYPGRLFPALIRAPGGAAQGLALVGLSAFDRDVLDAFEGDAYRRGVVPIMVGEELHEAEAYLPAISVPGGDPWRLEFWQVQHKAGMLVDDTRQAEEIRRRLMAARPH